MDDCIWTRDRKRLIYALRCPFTGEVHYVGKTTTGMLRPLHHLTDSHSEKVREWVRNIKELGYKPNIEVLEYVADDEDLSEREVYWIQYCFSIGCLLLNTAQVAELIVSPDFNTDFDHIESRKMDGLINISEFVRKKRKRIGLTQEEFAEYCGVALTVIRKIEQNQENISMRGILKILSKIGGCLNIIDL